MASPYKTAYRPKERKWTLEDVEKLYINENFSMELLANVMNVPIADLSKLLWKYKLPEKKQAFYKDVRNERLRLTEEEMAIYFDKEYHLTPKSSKSAEDDFFSGL